MIQVVSGQVGRCDPRAAQQQFPTACPQARRRGRRLAGPRAADLGAGLRAGQPGAAGAADAVAQGKKKRISRINYRFYRTLGVKQGPTVARADIIPFRSSADEMDSPVALFTGDKEVEFPRTWDKDGFVYIIQDQPLPLTVVAIMPELNTTKV